MYYGLLYLRAGQLRPRQWLKALLVSIALFTHFPAVAMASGESPFSWGGDLRLRVTDLNSIPFEYTVDSTDTLPDYRFARIRTRLWAEYQVDENVKLHGRAINETWGFDGSKTEHTGQNAPDEIIFDELYLDGSNLFGGKLDFRIGRQNFWYGDGKILINGTPLDGSRTFFFNAARIRLKQEHNSVDLLYIHNKARDALALHSQHRNLTEWDEDAVGFYASNTYFDLLSTEYYYLFKREHRQAGRREFSTAGVRMQAIFTEQLGAKIELATQWGHQGSIDHSGRLLAAELKYVINASFRPALSAGFYFLSGDKANTANRNEAWTTVFGRSPQYSDLYLYSFIDSEGGSGRWTNVHMPYIGVGLTVATKSSLQMNAYRVESDEASSTRQGHHRGNLITTFYRFYWTDNVTGHVGWEYFQPDDYYMDGISSSSFFRASMQYKF